jgi:hypothetical protein
MNKWMRERVKDLRAHDPVYEADPQSAYEVAHAEHKEDLAKKRKKGRIIKHKDF